MTRTAEFSGAYAKAFALDATDELRGFRDEFVIVDPDRIYLDGNSLGRLPKRTVAVVNDLVQRQWASELVGGWRTWFDLPQRLGTKLAGLIGAADDEVVACDSTSVNLFKLTMAALRLRPGRHKIVTDDGNFPSDLYVSAGAAALCPGVEVEVVRLDDDTSEATHRVEMALNENTALLSLSHTLFKSGYVHEMAHLTRLAHESGALVLWDLSHSVGALPLHLNACHVDLAVGCSYKYLSGGPGAPAFLFVRRALQAHLDSPIWGWLGHGSAFDFSLDYQPAPGIGRFLVGTPPILSMSAVEPGLDLLLEAGMERVRAKSVRQTEFLIELFDAHLIPCGFVLATPREPERRGSHISFSHPEAWRITQALIREMNVVPDFRAPNLLRLGVTPLYTSFTDLVGAVDRIHSVANELRYLNYSDARAKVT